MEGKSRKIIIIGITGLFLVILVLLGLTYAYFRTRIIGNNSNNPSINVTSKTMEVTYRDGSAVLSTDGKIEPGFTAEKQFSVENTGSEKATFSIIIDNVVNEFNKGTKTRGTYYDWKYTLYSGTKKVEANIIKSADIKFDSTQLIINNISINKDETKQYLLVVEYKNLDINQSADMGQDFSLRVNIVDDYIAWDYAKEGTLLYALKNNNEIKEPLTVPGKVASMPLMENEGKNITSQLTISELEERYFTYSDEYKINADGTYDLVNPKVIKFSENMSELNYKYVLNYDGSTNSNMPSKDFANSKNIYLVYFEYGDPSSENFRIWESYPEYESSLSSTEDDYGTSYYYRGYAFNNYVTYSNMCWRIVRIDGNGNIKIVLADENNPCDAALYSLDNKTSAFVEGRTDIAYDADASSLDYVRYETSDIPAILSKWMNDKALDTSKLVDAEWCEDISQSSLNQESWGNVYTYGTVTRLEDEQNANPSLKCSFSGINNTKANKITSKIGLLTADEVIFAGSVYDFDGSAEQLSHYLIDNANGGYAYWTMTPAVINMVSDPLSKDHFVYTVSSYGDLGYWSGTIILANQARGAVRPSVVLRSDVSITGLGTQTNPYVVK